MLQQSILAALSITFLLSSCVPAFSQSSKDTKKPRSVKRVARPQFNKDDWKGVFFEDLFRDGLVGQRPEPPTEDASLAKSIEDRDQSNSKTWSRLISAATLEDEVKFLQQQLSRDITTASKFRSDHVKVRQAFEQLSLMFGVIREYDSKIRWKKDAAVAQKTFEVAAVTARAGSEQAFSGSQRRLDALIQMVRGDRFPGKEKPPEQLDWSSVVGHSPIMERLQQIQDQLKTASSSEKSFKKERAAIIHAAELIAMMAETVQQPEMEYGEDDEYVAFAKQMQSAATDTAKAAYDNNFNVMSDAANRVGQSCTDCHGVFR
jgi:hypothetical protein